MSTWTYAPASPVVFDYGNVGGGASGNYNGNFVESFPSATTDVATGVTIQIRTTSEAGGTNPVWVWSCGGSIGAISAFGSLGTYSSTGGGVPILAGVATPPVGGTLCVVGMTTPSVVPGCHVADGLQTIHFVPSTSITVAALVAGLTDDFAFLDQNQLPVGSSSVYGELLSIAITYVAAPVFASFTVDSSGDPTFLVNASASTGPIVSYDWDWGDGSPHGSGVTASHTYLSNSYYRIRLTVSNGDATSNTSQLIRVGGGGAGLSYPGRAAWMLTDLTDLTTYSWEVNPKTASTVHRKTLQEAASSAEDGRKINFEGRSEVQKVSFSGTVLGRAQYDELINWFRGREQVLWTDDLGREAIVYILNFGAERVKSNRYKWKHVFSGEFVVLDWP